MFSRLLLIPFDVILQEIDDPTDKKPLDWVDAETIPDVTATKPDDWDENAPRTIIDDEAEKPEVRLL